MKNSGLTFIEPISPDSDQWAGNQSANLFYCSRSPIKSGMTGFTLIELSIVLVIIGLLAGGILVGQDLIKAAEMRAQISQIEQYKLAVNTFELKYDALPGDMTPQAAAQFGFFEVTGTGGGNGDGRLVGFCGTESLQFWRHLTDAKLISGQYGTSGNSAINPATGIVSGTVTDFSASFPVTKMPRGYVQVDGGINSNDFMLLGMLELSPGFCTPQSSVFTPNQFYTLDTKMDDGLPLKGRIQTVENEWAPTSTPTNCIISSVLDDPASTYNITGSNGNANSCSFLYVRF